MMSPIRVLALQNLVASNTKVSGIELKTYLEAILADFIETGSVSGVSLTDTAFVDKGQQLTIFSFTFKEDTSHRDKLKVEKFLNEEFEVTISYKSVYNISMDEFKTTPHEMHPSITHDIDFEPYLESLLASR